MNFNRPQISEALARLFGVKGPDSRGWSLTGEIQPTIPLPSLDSSPYIVGHGIQCGRYVFMTGAAGEHPYAIFRPGPNVILVVEQLVIANPNVAGGANLNVSIGMLSAAQLAALPLNASNKLLAISGTPDVNQLVSSNLAQADSVNSPNAFEPFHGVRLLPGTSIVIPFHKPGIVLSGAGSAGSPGLFVGNNGVATSIEVSGLCREWELPG